MDSLRKPTGSYRSLLHNRNFMALWSGQLVSILGDYLYFLAIPLMVNRLTGSTLMVGISTITSALPMLLFGPIAGVFVDRWNRKTTMIAADLARGVLVLFCMLVQRADQVWIYYLVGFLMSCVSRLFFPAQNAVLPTIVPASKDLLMANGLMQVVMTAGMLAGPALAGVSIGLWGSWTAFALDSLSFFLSAVAVSRLALPAHHAQRKAHGASLHSVYQEMKDGLDFMFTNPYLRPMLVGMLVANLCTGAINVVWVPYLQQAFQVGPAGLGLVDSAQGVGMLVGGFTLGFMAARFTRIQLAALCLALIGLVFMGMGWAPVFACIVGLAVGLGWLNITVQSVVTTILQMVVPDEKRGRVGSAINGLGMASALVSMAVVAVIGERLGLGNVYILCGVINGSAAVLTLIIGREPEDSLLPEADG